MSEPTHYIITADVWEMVVEYAPHEDGCLSALAMSCDCYRSRVDTEPATKAERSADRQYWTTEARP